jgi:hypothetical protein
LQDAIANEFHKLPWLEKKNISETWGHAELLERFLRRFRSFARQLQHRHDGRVPLIIQDEYDIQDLLHAVLRGFFDDVRPEEYVPSYAGSGSRMDFLIKSEKIVVEVKMTNVSLRDKQIGEQLLIDIGRYQSHPDCQRLICFVYDPGGHLKNPTGLENDLGKTHEKLDVKVIVVSA